MANERTNRKAVLAALGQNTTAAQNEQTYNKAVIAGVGNVNLKTKPAIVALTPASTAADIVAALKA